MRCLKTVFKIGFLILLGTVTLSVGAEDLKEKIHVLKEKVKEAQTNFPTGDLENTVYVTRILTQMYLLDQEVRNAFLSDLKDPEVYPLISEMDAFHTQKMKEILNHHGWITISRFGSEADHQAWMLVQHADDDPLFQAGCLFVLEKLIEIGESNPKNYAYLYDRVALKFAQFGMKQKYGTQVNASEGEFKLCPYEGTGSELNQRRREMGLEPINAYLEEVKSFYQK